MKNYYESGDESESDDTRTISTGSGRKKKSKTICKDGTKSFKKCLKNCKRGKKRNSNGVCVVKKKPKKTKKKKNKYYVT
jgi:hypothetical protein